MAVTADPVGNSDLQPVGGTCARSEVADPLAVLAQADAENFPVASRLLPRRVRGHLMALYGFARLVDDSGDEAAGDRLALLDEIERDLDRLYAGRQPRQPVLAPLAATIPVCQLPRAPFDALIEANRVDQRRTRYATWEDLLGYCTLSANPVGHLVLHVAGAATPARLVLSDHICSALQIIEHLQDVGEDLLAGRVYLPQRELDRYGVREHDLAEPRASAEVQSLFAHLSAKTERLLDRGSPLVGALSGWSRLATAGFVGGGRATLVALARTGHDVLSRSAHPTRGRLALLSASTFVRGR